MTAVLFWVFGIVTGISISGHRLRLGGIGKMSEYWSNGVATLYQADARAMPLPDASVHMCVTSPPYWGLRDYGLGQWQGGDAECGHKIRPITKHRSSTLVGTAHNATSGGAMQGWKNGICGHCGAVQQPAGIGLEPTLGEWVESIVAVMREVRRVLRDDGTVLAEPWGCVQQQSQQRARWRFDS